MALPRRCLVFEPDCATLVSSPVSHNGNASELRFPRAHAIGRTTLLRAALMDAGCAASVPSPVALFALTPSWGARPLARSLVPSTRTACRSSAINIARGRYVCCSFCWTSHVANRGRTYCFCGLAFFARTATAARNRRSSDEQDTSHCAFSHALRASMEVKSSAECSTLRAGALTSRRKGRTHDRMPKQPASSKLRRQNPSALHEFALICFAML